ncbi:unnamed protein product [Rotaria sordida]|uniref:CUB domain-containing protein n=1 Tax=Rotaria sordida TaxID=392033 RepID=A0A814QB46_9BILA|nr:unnamed protein product [Rotaria sordida]
MNISFYYLHILLSYSIDLSITMNFNIISLILFIIFIQQSLTQVPPVVPLTNALTAVYCHNSDEPGIMTIRCGPNEKIRMLDAFDATVKHRSRLPIQCLKQKQQYSKELNENSNSVDCKIHTSFTSACSGRENCTLHMQRIRLNSVQDNCHNELVDYTMAFFECISDVFIHDVCSSQAITSAWGTLQTPNFPNPYTSSDDCWCKLSTQLQHRLLLSIIVFQLIPYDKHCAGAGLYLQSSNEQRSTQCTYLQQGHNYLSDTNSLYINFYSRTPTVRGGFWIIYEASHPNAEVHLHCGSHDKIGVPSSSNSQLSPSISTPFDHGWSRLAFNNPPNPTTPINDHMMRMRMRFTSTTPYSSINTNYKINTSTAVGAFTYPHGALTTFELAYGPSGWYLKHPIDALNKTLNKFVRTTTVTPTLSISKWNFTWYYTRPRRIKLVTTKRTSTTTESTTTTKQTTLVFSTTTKTTTTTTTTTTTISTSTSTTQTATAHQRLLFTHQPWVFYSSSSSQSFTPTTKTTTIKSTIQSSTSSSTLSSMIIKSTLPLPTPWYSPAGPFDWWQWQWYTKKSKTSSINFHYTTQTITTSTQITSTTRKISPTTSTIVITTTTTPSTTVTTASTLMTTISTTRLTESPSTTRLTKPPSTTRLTEPPSTTRLTEPPSTTRLTKLPNMITTSSKYEPTADWLQWPYKEIDTNKKDPSDDDFEDEYQDWLDYFTASKNQGIITSTVTPSTLISISSEQPYPYLDHIPTKSKWKVITINTPPAKRHHSQPNPGVNERNALGIQSNEQTSPSNVHNMIRRVIEQRNKKNSTDYGWLSKTDMTIVAVSILFVILLAIINLILFAVRRHRHRIQGRHLLSTSISSTLDNRRLGGGGGGGGSGHLHSQTFTDTTNGLINTTNNTNNNNDILPAVGEIVIWDEKDQGGYMIDNNGTWAKIEGRQWFGSHIFKNCSKTPLAKSFRSRFRFMRHLDKKGNHHHHHHPQPPITPKTHQIQQQTFKFPLLMDTATLSPVPEADDYESSELSLSDIIIRSSATTLNHSNRRPHHHQHQPLMKSERKHDLSLYGQQQTTKTIQALIHTEQQQNDDDYYKRIGNNGDNSNYTGMSENALRDSSITDQETDRSLGNEIDAGGPVVVSVPTMIRRDDDTGTITDGAESIYNPHYSIQSVNEYSHRNYIQSNTNTGPFSTKPSISTFKPTTNNSVIIGYCQNDFQSLDPKLLFKTNDKTSLIEHQPFYRCTQSVQLSTYDSGFVDEQTVGSLTAINNINEFENNLINKDKNEHMSMDDILLTKSEEDDDDDNDDDGDLQLNDLITDELRNSNQQKWKNISKHVSFQEEHITQRFSPPLPPLSSSFNTTANPETLSNPFDTYDVSPDIIQSVPIPPPLLKSFLPPTTTLNDNSLTTSSVFTVQKQITSIDNEDDNTESIIMNHLHSVKSLKKFFETKMVIQQPISTLQTITCSQSITTINEQKFDRSSITKEQKSIDESDQRQEMMNKVLESLKKKKLYSRTTNDTPEPSGRCSAMTTSSYDSNITQNLAVQRHYSRRFRSSSTSNNSLYPGGNIIIHINPTNSYHNKRAFSQDRQHYHTTDHHLSNIEKWKQEQQRQIESDDEDNISENSMLWQARTKLNEFVTRTRKTQQQQSPYYTTCTNGGTPSEDIYMYDDNESVTAETRF